MDTDDQTLWARLATADEQAFAELFRRHSDAVYNFAFRRTASWSVAEDVTQTTFTALWRRARAGSVDPLRSGSALAVLLVMAGHECHNQSRSRIRRHALVERVGSQASGARADHADQVAGAVDDERRMSDVRRALDALPRSQREVVELVAWSGCSGAEAAAALGVSEGTVKSRLFRARTRLAGLLTIEGDLA